MEDKDGVQDLGGLSTEKPMDTTENTLVLGHSNGNTVNGSTISEEVGQSLEDASKDAPQHLDDIPTKKVAEFKENAPIVASNGNAKKGTTMSSENVDQLGEEPFKEATQKLGELPTEEMVKSDPLQLPIVDASNGIVDTGSAPSEDIKQPGQDSCKDNTQHPGEFPTEGVVKSNGISPTADASNGIVDTGSIVSDDSKQKEHDLGKSESASQNSDDLPIEKVVESEHNTPFDGARNGIQNTDSTTIEDAKMLDGNSFKAQHLDTLPTEEAMDTEENTPIVVARNGIEDARFTAFKESEQSGEDSTKISTPFLVNLPNHEPMETQLNTNEQIVVAPNGIANTSSIVSEESKLTENMLNNATKQLIDHPVEEMMDYEEGVPTAGAHNGVTDTSSMNSGDVIKQLGEDVSKTSSFSQHDDPVNGHKDVMATPLIHNLMENTTRVDDSGNEPFAPKEAEAIGNAVPIENTTSHSILSDTVQNAVKPETKDTAQQTDVVTKYHRGRRFSEPAAFDLSRSDLTAFLRETHVLPALPKTEKVVQNLQEEVLQSTDNNNTEMVQVVDETKKVSVVQAVTDVEKQNHDDNINESGQTKHVQEASAPISSNSERDFGNENAPPPKKAKLQPLQIHTESMEAEEFEEYNYSSSSSRSPSPQRPTFFFKLGTNKPAVKETKNSPSSPKPAVTFQKPMLNSFEKKKELFRQAEQLKRRKIIQKIMEQTKESVCLPRPLDANKNHNPTTVFYKVNRDYSTIPRPQNSRETDMTKMVQDKILGEEAARANGCEPGTSEVVKPPHTVPLQKTGAINQALAELLSVPVQKIVLEKHHLLPEFRPTYEYIPQIVDSTPFETHDEQMKLLYKISSNNPWTPPNRDAPLPHEHSLDYWNWTAGQFISWVASFCHNKYVLSNLLLGNLNGKMIFAHEPDYSLLRHFGLNVEVSNVICHNFRILKDKCRILGNMSLMRLPQGFF